MRAIRPSSVAAHGGPRLPSPAGRWVLLATVVGSGVVLIDGTVIDIALPAIGRDVGAGLVTLHWTVTAYLLALSAPILSGRALGDRSGRRKVFEIDTAWFAMAALLRGPAPSEGVLVAARALRGAGPADCVGCRS